MPALSGSAVVLGGGVAGLTTALELKTKHPNIKVTLVAKFLPGDVAQTEYCSPQAGANWTSFESEWNRHAWYDKFSFERFLRIADEYPESGVERFPFRLVHGDESDQSKKPWFEDVVGGTRPTPKEELPPGAVWGMELTTFMFNSRLYLSWYAPWERSFEIGAYFYSPFRQASTKTTESKSTGSPALVQPY